MTSHGNHQRSVFVTVYTLCACTVSYARRVVCKITVSREILVSQKCSTVNSAHDKIQYKRGLFLVLSSNFKKVKYITLLVFGSLTKFRATNIRNFNIINGNAIVMSFWSVSFIPAIIFRIFRFFFFYIAI